MSVLISWLHWEEEHFCNTETANKVTKVRLNWPIDRSEGVVGIATPKDGSQLSSDLSPHAGFLLSSYATVALEFLGWFFTCVCICEHRLFKVKGSTQAEGV